MKDRSAVRERYLRDSLPVRLGGLAANLSRIKSFAAHEGGREAVESLLDESKFFIEWTGSEAKIEQAEELVELQIQLARWQHNWERIWSNPPVSNVKRSPNTRPSGQSECWRCQGY